MSRLAKSSLAAIFALLLVSCTSPGPKPVTVKEKVVRKTAATTQDLNRPVQQISELPATVSTTPTFPPKAERSIYFEFDRYNIKSDYQGVVAQHSQALVQKSQEKILIQGNADERGSSEYNLALGQKRAQAVKRAMLLLGVGENQIEAVSLGEEKPRNPGHHEDAWADNRRADILYQGEF